jgi:hypothetical protein
VSTTRNRTLTEDELGALVASSRAGQNLEPYITNTAVIAKVACLAASALRARAAEAVMADAGTSTE